MKESSTLRAGDWVEVRSREEILKTLDKSGRLDGLPFMPEMFQFCGQRLQVFKRAHKTCDTIARTGGRCMTHAVHLKGAHCDGQAHGGCQALCLLFWKDDWLKLANGAPPKRTPPSAEPVHRSNCAEGDLLTATCRTNAAAGEERVYACQATELLNATSPLPWWRAGQYVEDYSSRNVGLARLANGFIYAVYYRITQAGIGLGPILRWAYDRFQALIGGVPFPRRTGTIPVGQPTPSCSLDLKPGELVRVKPHREILATLNTEHRNRGLWFDAEAVPFCGGTYRVLRRVSKIIDEKTGRLVSMKNDCVILEEVYCQARYSTCTMFCPRSIYHYWREVWLERVEQPPKT